MAVLVVALGLVGYLVLSARASRAAERDVVTGYLKAWATRDYDQMYQDIAASAKADTSKRRFARLERSAMETATATALVPGPAHRDGDAFEVPVAVRTRAFGTLRATMRFPLDGSGSDARIRWTRSLTFPGLRPGETLTRSTTMPPRADILARDGTALARGDGRSSPVPNLASQVVGALGQAQPADRAQLRRLGVPADEKVGTTGLERILNPELVGTPGGTLKAGSRVLEHVSPEKAAPVRTSISLPVLKATVEAQQDAPTASGATVINSRTGEVLAFQGSAFSLLQAPGSTMKIVTASAALTAGLAKPTTTYPAATKSSTPIVVQNSDEESCGGTFIEAFAHSCNSVFVPLGGRIGPERLVAMAERFGFNRPVAGVPNAAVSVIPKAEDLGGDAGAAISAIGQGKVQASSLEAALMAATVANDGKQPEVTFLRSSHAAKTRTVLSHSVADDMRQAMEAVVKYGTGTKAAVPGVTTAGKTGTSEIRATQGDACKQQAAPDADPQAPPPDTGCGNADGKSTDAWMAAFAPASGSSEDPIAIGVLRTGDYQGGRTAAPVASKALAAALKQ